MLPFSSVRNALNDDHSADFISLYLLDENETECIADKHYREKRSIHLNAFKMYLADKEVFQNSQTLDCVQHGIRIHVDSMMRGSDILRLSNKPFPIENDVCYPVLLKSANLLFKKDNMTLRKTQTMHTYKAEVCFACVASGVNAGFLVGRDFNWGMVDISGSDLLYLDVISSVACWAHIVVTDKTLCMNPPSRPELYPNMRATSKRSIQQIKHKIAYDLGEITLIRDVSLQNRKNAHQCGIFSWRDSKFSSACLGLKNSAVQRRVDLIARANTGCDPLIRPTASAKELYSTDVFIDIETLDASDVNGPTNFVFLIGLGTVNGFVQYRTQDMSLQEELRILKCMMDFLHRTEGGKIATRRLLHWSDYEKIVFEKCEQRHNIMLVADFEWVDMCKMLQLTDFFPKYAFSYSLKSVATAMYKLGMIQTIWQTACTDGQTAMLEAYYAYLSDDMSTLSDIEEYNRVDVVTTMEIWKYLTTLEIVM
jgi:hypothetical protein